MPFTKFCRRLVLAVLPISVLAHGQAVLTGNSFTSSATPKTNYSTSIALVVGPGENTYLKFSLAGLPAGLTSNNISAANMVVYVDAVSTSGTMDVYAVAGSWSAGTITYNNAPALGSKILSAVPISTTGYVSLNLTSTVQAWLNGTLANNGIALVPTSGSSILVSIDSLVNILTSHPAELDIVFQGPILGITTAAGSGLTGGGTSGTLNLSLTNACAANQILEWNGTEWACANPGGVGTITGVTAGTGLTGGGTSGNVTLNVNEGVVAFQSDLTNGINTAETFATNAANTAQAAAESFATTAATTAQNTAEAYANSTFLPLAGGTMTGTLNLAGPSGTGLSMGGNLFAFGSYANTDAFVGFSGNTTMTGTNVTANGYNALLSNTTGSGNTADGAYALTANTTGAANTATGSSALTANTTGSSNTAIGENAAFSNTTGYLNTASGNQALYFNTIGYANTTAGMDSMFSNTTGNYNTAAGMNALYYNATGSNNTALGYSAGPDQNSTSLSNATAIGANAVVSESNALVLGCVSGANNCLGAVNVGIGTATPAYTLDVHGTGSFTGLVNFATGQTFPGTGTITGVTPGTGLTGGGNSGSVTLSVSNAGITDAMLQNSSLTVIAGTDLTGGGAVSLGGSTTLNLDTTKVPQLAANNTFTGTQTIDNNVSILGTGPGSALSVSGATTGVTGQTVTNGGSGLYGVDTSPTGGYAIYGVSTNGTGVYGSATASEGSTIGVYGSSNSLSGGAGVYGSNTTQGPTLCYGVCGAGVYGFSNFQNGAGVLGYNTDSEGNGVVGSASSADGWGVVGVGYFGVVAYSTSNYGAAVYSNGNLAVAEGYTKSGVAVLPDDRAVLLYSMESPENWYEDFGSGKLQNGATTINIEPTYAQTVNTTIEYHVFLTPKGDCKGLYVTNETATTFDVRELGGGQSSVTFDYRIVAKRKGLESLRLEVISTDHEQAETMRRHLASRPANPPALGRMREPRGLPALFAPPKPLPPKPPQRADVSDSPQLLPTATPKLALQPK